MSTPQPFALFAGADSFRPGVSPLSRDVAAALFHGDVGFLLHGFVTNYIEAEAHALLLRKLGRSLAREWLLAGGLPVVRVLAQEEDRAKELIARYTDKDWSLCDATSFAVMERRGVRTAFSFDVHFRQYGKFEVLGL